MVMEESLKPFYRTKELSVFHSRFENTDRLVVFKRVGEKKWVRSKFEGNMDALKEHLASHNFAKPELEQILSKLQNHLATHEAALSKLKRAAAQAKA